MGQKNVLTQLDNSVPITKIEALTGLSFLVRVKMLLTES
jgi:hypothetical protein